MKDKRMLVSVNIFCDYYQTINKKNDDSLISISLNDLTHNI